jgi:hypothetical protein
MVQMTKLFIEDEQMLRNVVAYIMTLNPEPESSEKTLKQPIEDNPFKDVRTVEQ